MSFVRLATGLAWSAAFRNRTCPVATSTKIAADASTRGTRIGFRGTDNLDTNGDGSRWEARGWEEAPPGERACPAPMPGRAATERGAPRTRPRRRAVSRAAKVVAQVGTEEGLLELPRGGAQVGERLGRRAARIRVLLTERRRDDLIEERGFAIREVLVHREMPGFDPVPEEILHDRQD